MRYVVLLLVAASLSPVPAVAQTVGSRGELTTSVPSSSESAFLKVEATDDALLAAAAGAQRQGGRRLRCCNRRAALVFGAIGAGAGLLLTSRTCDAGDCTTSYVSSGLILGGIGATLGAFVQPSHGHRALPTDRRLHVFGLATSTVRAAFTRVAW